MIDPKEHDFPKLIAELESAGITIHTISKMMRRQFIQVKRWKAGSQPKHWEGEMLLMLHASYVTTVSNPATAEVETMA